MGAHRLGWQDFGKRKGKLKYAEGGITGPGKFIKSELLNASRGEVVWGKRISLKREIKIKRDEKVL